jgi:hypothetical protein
VRGEALQKSGSGPVQDLFSLDDDATLLWVGYHPVWLIWGDERLRLDLRRYYVTGEVLELVRYRRNGHLSRVDDARAPEDVLECMALSELDEDPEIAAAVRAGVERFFGQRMLFRFKRQNTPGRRWARWMIRRRMISPGEHAERLDAACTQLVAFGASTPDPHEPAPVAKARIECIYQAARHRPETAGVAAEVLNQYAVGTGFPPRRLAAQRLGDLPFGVAHERLLALMTHANPVVRENAAFAFPRRKPLSDRRALVDALFGMLDDPEVGVASEALTTFVDVLAAGTRMARFRDFAAQVAANPAHRLHAPLLEAVAWSSDHHRARPGFHRRVGVAKAAISGPEGVGVDDGADDLDDLDA